MDDSCAVCAETLEWVAYGPCGHREVCSTCVSRLRFICEDRRCCICKTESDVVFVTKALGDYTKVISDFSVFPSDATEGKVGNYWYHEDMRAYFDDSDHYKMIKAMCRLSCSVCDKMEDQGGQDGPKRKAKFRNIEQLKSHLYHRHKLVMCSLCLEGRKIFICEHKLYTRAQLNQHINTGDSEVDGSESERGGFMGHPMCDFCRRPFYGDNELYTHMSTEHFTCHICQRQHPGQYDYFKNYDDLEASILSSFFFGSFSFLIHFRQQHFLCEDEACLAKKFIVFQSESEMKRHNAIEHGGNMSRSKRNAVLQIPTSFRYRLRSNEQDRHRGRGRGRGSRSDSSENQLAMAIQASLETANSDNRVQDVSSSAQATYDHRETSGIDDIIPPMESLATSDSELSWRYLQAVSQSSRNAPLAESSFPPLSGAPGSTQQNPSHDRQGLGKNSMAARLRRSGNGAVNVVNGGQCWSTKRGVSGGFVQSRPAANYGLVSSSSSTSSPQTKPATLNGPVPSSYASTAQARPETAHGLASASSGSSSWNSSNKARVSHSSSAPNLVERGAALDSSMSAFPPVTATRKDKLSTSKQPLEKVEDVHTANKSLVERIRAALEFDENKYTAFKEISSEFRLGVIDTGEYLSYVQQFGLSHLVLELARLCPDTLKQRELINTYNASVRGDSAHEKSWGSSSSQSRASNSSNKGKGKRVEEAEDSLADSIIDTVRKLQANNKPSEGEVEVLSKDGYRTSKGKSVAEEKLGPSTANQKPGGGGGGGKEKKKKIPKFHRVRLGDDLRHSDPDPGPEEETTDSMQDLSEGLPVRGVWRKGGGQKLFS
ncbi:zinc finger protein [Macleaya cordata]|uniref:RING-type E3 ubiquitin transferase n=1 Tax=Macleaya cordata TaxID=56857 RepID=A0A200R1V5_MACCD|nr:zinc finger protein [Macleaya cordata]